MKNIQDHEKKATINPPMVGPRTLARPQTKLPRESVWPRLPGGAISVTRDTTTTAILDGGRNFGTVAAARAVDLAVEKARTNQLGCAVAHNCHHVARLGAFAERAARRDMICMAWASWPKAGHFVAPWGGREGRLATNPFAYAIPSDDSENPITLDMSTSATSECVSR